MLGHDLYLILFMSKDIHDLLLLSHYPLVLIFPLLHLLISLLDTKLNPIFLISLHSFVLLHVKLTHLSALFTELLSLSKPIVLGVRHPGYKPKLKER